GGAHPGRPPEARQLASNLLLPRGAGARAGAGRRGGVPAAGGVRGLTRYWVFVGLGEIDGDGDFSVAPTTIVIVSASLATDPAPGTVLITFPAMPGGGLMLVPCLKLVKPRLLSLALASS